MSHITNIAVNIRDIAALKAACRELGLQFNEGDTAYKCWTQYLLDTGFTEEDAKRAAESMKVDWDNRLRSVHSIGLKGCYGQIGVYKNPAGAGYMLGFDPWSPSNDTDSWEAKLGRGMEKLKQAYSIAKLTIEARAKGWQVTRKNLSNGTVKLSIAGV